VAPVKRTKEQRMSEQDRYIPGVPCWADTSQPDPEAAASFYARLFGWQVEDVMPPDAPGSYFMARIRGENVAAIGSQPEGAPREAVWQSYVWVEDADETAEKVRSAGGTVLTEPFDVPEAGRMAVFADPEGAVICVWQPRAHRGATVVNEHGSLNFNVLNTRDLDGAARFYAAVFGWDVLSVQGRPMWALAGYGDFLERRTPGMRERMRAMGAPERFEDVVAGIVPLGPDQPETPAHWGVTFAVDDADAIAARAAELGGRVVVPPVDGPWVRMTVIADPAGATFTASQFVPENSEVAAPGSAAG
jgi:predicted enzyme related to lactoylglutathione lyase